jgi:hypothetical protein
VSDFDPATGMDAIENAVAYLTGLRNALVAQGWDRASAEQAVIVLLRIANRGQQQEETT